MNLENVSAKQLNEVERLTRDLLAALRKAKLQNEPVAESLRQLEIELGQMRRSRFDNANPEYHAY
jgi:hypothetical protein